MSGLMDDLREAAASVNDHYEGKLTLRTHKVPEAKPVQMSARRVRRIRDSLHTSRRTVEKWEQGVSKPAGTAAALLALVDKHPELISDLAEVA
jgi:putative transcriptional regulator